MQRIKRVEKYLYTFFSFRTDDYEFKYKAVHQSRQTEIYLLQHGPKIMDLLIHIHYTVRESFCFKKLVPQRFATAASLFIALNEFKKDLIESDKILKPHLKGDDTNYIVRDLVECKAEIVKAIEYAIEMYDMEDNVIPYQELRLHLINQDIDSFIKILKSILSSVSYAITKTKEGYFHSNVHLILKLLGFEIISEEQTNIGRIDAVIRFINTVYILEFKFDDMPDAALTALQQIKEKGYYEKFMVEKKKIIGIGISFNSKTRNILEYRSQIMG